MANTILEEEKVLLLAPPSTPEPDTIRLPETSLQWLQDAGPVPAIQGLSLPDVYELVSDATGTPDYKHNLLSFWFLDVLSEALLRAQSESEQSQKDLLAWFTHLLAFILDNPTRSREEVLDSLAELMISSVCDGQNHPAGLERVADILYSIFGNAFPFSLMQRTFQHPPPISRSEVLFHLHVPKKLVPTEQGKLAEKDEGKKKECILPLQEAVSDTFFDTLFDTDQPKKAVKQEKKVKKNDGKGKKGKAKKKTK